MIKEAVFFYLGCLLSVVVIFNAARDELWVLCGVHAFSLSMPGLVHAVNMFFVLSIVKKEMSRKEKLREAMYSILNLTMGRTAYQYWEGKTPIWSLKFKQSLGLLTVKKIPAVTINVIELLTGALEPGFSRTYLIGFTLFILVEASMSVSVVHTCIGPPGNMQKYRFWNLDRMPYFHVFVAFLIDFTQVYYRLLLLSLVAVFASVGYECALILVMGIATSMFVRIGLGVVQPYRGYENLMSAVTGLENVVYDYPWLEPVPVYSFYIEASFFLRVTQALLGVWMIAANWEKHTDLDLALLSFAVVSCAVAAGIYFSLYPFYVYYLMKDRVALSHAKRDKFISEMFANRYERSLGTIRKSFESPPSIGFPAVEELPEKIEAPANSPEVIGPIDAWRETLTQAMSDGEWWTETLTQQSKWSVRFGHTRTETEVQDTAEATHSHPLTSVQSGEADYPFLTPAHPPAFIPGAQ